MWIDSHAHLSSFSPDELHCIVSRAHEHGVTKILNVGTSLSSSSVVCSQCESCQDLFAAIGVSPFDVTHVSPGWLEELSVLAKKNAVVAIGETGIDDSNPVYPDIGLQKQFFLRQCELAYKEKLAIIVHSRGCEQEALDICKDQGIKKAVFHCYTGSLPALENIVDAGYYISFSGIITFKNSLLDSLVAATPLSSILIETDTPYLSPVPHRGKPNEPAWVSLIGKKVALLKNCDERMLALAIQNNFDALFGIRQ